MWIKINRIYKNTKNMTLLKRNFSNNSKKYIKKCYLMMNYFKRYNYKLI